MADYPGIGFLLNDVGRLLRLSFERKAGPSGLTRAQWAVLANLQRHDAIKQAELAGLLEVDPVTVTRLVDRLVAAGLVVRRPDADDRRVNRLSLTEQAQPYIERLSEIAAVVRKEALEGLDQAEVERFAKTAERIRANLSRARALHGERDRTAAE